MEPVEIETKSAFARRVGRSPARISQWQSEGRLVPPAVRPDGRIDVALALAQLEGLLAPGAPAANREPAARRAPSEFAAARLRREQAAATRAEIELGAVEGRYRRDALAPFVAGAATLGDVLLASLDVRRLDLVNRIRAAPDQAAALASAKAMDLALRAVLYGEVRQIARREIAELSPAGRAEVLELASEVAPQSLADLAELLRR
jgi:hypothetical protein